MVLSNNHRWLILLSAIWLLAAPLARADAALLLEEPYGHLGAFTSTGHVAVYLTRVCADSPTVLRRCAEGEPGVVISRYNKIAGRDWLAIPLIPYLYAVEDSDEIPLFANPKIVAFLRNQYRKRHLEAEAADQNNGEPPEGNWTQLIGAAYDRTIYGFEIETTTEQDDRFIEEYNSQVNRARFNFLVHNCADFARDVINSYYPKTLHRSLVADIGVTTPKQISKLLVKFSQHHPELRSSNFVVPQVPGTMPRSTPVHGIIESVLRAKKYLLPIAVLHPFVTGCLAAAYVGEGRFDPKRQALILESGRNLQPPLPAADRRDYQVELKNLSDKSSKAWLQMQAAADPEFDETGKPVLRMHVGEDVVALGISRDNILNTFPSLGRGLVLARLQMELRNGPEPRASEADVTSDWKLLDQLTLVERASNYTLRSSLSTK